ncbi:MAG: protein-tyrosine phosphatase [Chlamydiales bacterium]|jgi:protein-tyrosine phosphatase
MSKIAVMFVCLGNICRSPAGEGILKDLAEKGGYSNKLHVESCGTGNWHIGSLPDSRMREAASKRGIDLSSRAQEFRGAFFGKFDYILAADNHILQELLSLAGDDESKGKLYLINDFSKSFKGQDVPDPYYGGDQGFEKVLDMFEEACAGLLATIFECGHEGKST